MQRKLKLTIGALITGAAALICATVISSCAILGKLPEGERLENVKRSPHYRDGTFHNLEETPMFSSDSSTLENYWNFLFNDWERLKPEVPLTRVLPDLETLKNADNYFVWLGHSSVLFKLSGKIFIVDPVFNDYAAPAPFLNTAFTEDPVFSLDYFKDLDIEAVILTHDHYDHLEMDSMKALADKVELFICPLGVGAHLEAWKIPADKIKEGDWGDIISFYDLNFNFVTARHFSGRLFSRNRTLWTGYVITREGEDAIYLSGDSGYGSHFKSIGEKFPDIKLALLECGQYNKNWPLIHMTPEESAQSSLDVMARFAVPLHAGRFAMSSHSWDDPFLRFDAAMSSQDNTALYPLMGQIVFLDGLENPKTVQELNNNKWWIEDAIREQEAMQQ